MADSAASSEACLDADEGGIGSMWERALSLGNSALRALMDSGDEVADASCETGVAVEEVGVVSTDSAASSKVGIAAGEAGVASEEPGVVAEEVDIELAWERVARSKWRRVAPSVEVIDPMPKCVALSEASAPAETDVDPMWKSVASSEPYYGDVVKLLMLGGIPGVCGPGRTAEEREMNMNHNHERVEVVNRLWLASTTESSSCCGGRGSGQHISTNVDSAGDELLDLFDKALVPSITVRRVVFLLYLFTYAAYFGWIFFALPSIVLPIRSLVSARDWIDAPDWVWWMSLCGSGTRVLNLTLYLRDHNHARTSTKDARRVSRLSWFGLGWDVLIVFYLVRTDKSVDDWDSDAVGHRVGTFFLVVAGTVVMLVWLVLLSTSYFPKDYHRTFSESCRIPSAIYVAPKDWELMRQSAALVLRVKEAPLKLEDRSSLVEMCKHLFKLVDKTEARNAVRHATHVLDKYSAMVWLCIDALAHLPENQRDPEFAISTICSFGVTVYDCFSTINEWYTPEPALAPIVACTTLHDDARKPRIFKVHKGRPTKPERAYVETSTTTGGAVPSFDTRGNPSSGRPYSSSSGTVRVTIPMQPQAFVSKPQHTGLLGLVNTAVAVWFLVHWEFDVYHAFLTPAVLGELWALLWVGIWWCAGEAPLAAFVDPVHWLIGQREHVPEGAVRMLAGEASAAVLGVVAALTAIDYYTEGGIVGIVALAVAAVLKRFAKGKDIAVVCFVAYLSELVLEVVIVIYTGNFTLVRIVLGVTAALESMILTIRLLQVLVGRIVISKRLPVGTDLSVKKNNCFTRESWFCYAVACGHWGAVFTGHHPLYIMEDSVCSGDISLSTEVVDRGERVGYHEVLNARIMCADKEPGWGYVVSARGERTSSAWNLPADKGFTVFEVGSWYGKRYPCV